MSKNNVLLINTKEQIYSHCELIKSNITVLIKSLSDISNSELQSSVISILGSLDMLKCVGDRLVKLGVIKDEY